MTDLKHLIHTCAYITKSKGFDVSMHATMIAQMSGEVAEALEHVTLSGDPMTDLFIHKLTGACNDFEAYRRGTTSGVYCDTSQVKDLDKLLSELSDKVLRVFSYVGGNGWGDQFVASLLNKMQENSERPALHGKGF